MPTSIYRICRHKNDNFVLCFIREFQRQIAILRKAWKAVLIADHFTCDNPILLGKVSIGIKK